MIRLRRLLVLPLLLTAWSAVSAAPIDIQIDRSKEKFNLGLANFTAGDKKVDASLLSAHQSVIQADLDFPKIFNLLTSGPAVVKKNDALAWSKLGSDVVMSAVIESASGDKLEISAKLQDTRSGKELLSVSRTGTRAGVRSNCHEISNEVVKYFTGQPSFFTSKIAFVNDATGRKELYIADYDGKNLKRLTNDNSIVILPRLSPDGKHVVFTSYVGGNPDLYIMNTDGTGRRKISGKSGLNVSPSWAPSSEELAVTLSPNGTAPNIFLMDLQGNVKNQITDAAGADTAPSFSPDGSQISFTSDRAGAPHIYIMGLDGSGLRRITTASHCDSSAWSPDGQTILYVKGENRGRFDIYSIEVLTGLERRLTWGEGDNENPSWSPDGRFVLFMSTRRGRKELFTMLADGSEQKVLPTNNGGSYTPHWGK